MWHTKRQSSVLAQLEAAHQACNKLLEQFRNTYWVVENAYRSCTEYHAKSLPEKPAATGKAGSRTAALTAFLIEEKKRREQWEAHQGYFSSDDAEGIIKEWSALCDACRDANKLVEAVNDLFLEVTTDRWKPHCHRWICDTAWNATNEFEDIISEANKHDPDPQNLDMTTILIVLPAVSFRDAFKDYHSDIPSALTTDMRAEFLRARRVVIEEEAARQETLVGEKRPPNATEQAIIDHLYREGFIGLESLRVIPKQKRPTAETISRPAIGRGCDGQFKATLKHMVDLGWLDNARHHGMGGGYFVTDVGSKHTKVRPKSGPSQD